MNYVTRLINIAKKEWNVLAEIVKIFDPMGLQNPISAFDNVNLRCELADGKLDHVIEQSEHKS